MTEIYSGQLTFETLKKHCSFIAHDLYLVNFPRDFIVSFKVRSAAGTVEIVAALGILLAALAFVFSATVLPLPTQTMLHVLKKLVKRMRFHVRFAVNRRCDFMSAL
jgi:hypothetical protein